MDNVIKHSFRQDIKILEGHAHLTFPMPIDEAVELFRKYMEFYKVQRLQFLSVPHSGKVEGDMAQNLKLLYVKSRLSPRAYVAAGLYHTPGTQASADDFLQQAKTAYEAGADSYKMLEGKPSVYKSLGSIPLDDAVYDKFYSFAEQNQLPVLMHVADPAIFWDFEKCGDYAKKAGWFCDETFPKKEELHKQTEGVLKKHPALKLILAHFHFLADDIERCAKLFDTYPNLYFDMTPGGEQFVFFNEKIEEWKEFFKKYKKRLIYGTDTYNFHLSDTMQCGHMIRINQLRTFLETDNEFEASGKKVYGIKLDKDLLEDIYHNNLYNLLGEPKALNYDAMAKECDRLLNIQSNDDLHTIKAYLEWMQL